MRVLLVWLLTVALAVGSTGAVAAQLSEADDGPDARAEHPGLYFAGPGYYPYGGEAYHYRFHDGEEWIGPVVGLQVAAAGNQLIFTHGLDPEAVLVLSLMFTGPGGAEILELVLRILLAVASELAPSEESGQAEEPVQAEEPGQNYRLGWGDTKHISFNGRVTGSGDQWRYESDGEPIRSNMTAEQQEGARGWCTLGPPSPFQHEEPIEFYCELTLGEGPGEKVKGHEYTHPRGEKDFVFSPKWDSTGLRLLSCHTDPTPTCPLPVD